jgi:G3E family GTPase
VKAAPLRFHVPPFESWSWAGTKQIDHDRLLAFASDPALNIYRLKGRFRLTDGRAILLHKVGSEITSENTTGTLETSHLVAIGTKPDFNIDRTDNAWAKVIQCPEARD